MKDVRFCFILPSNLRDKMQEYADREDVSVGHVVRKAIKHWFKHEDEERIIAHLEKRVAKTNAITAPEIAADVIVADEIIIDAIEVVEISQTQRVIDEEI